MHFSTVLLRAAATLIVFGAGVTSEMAETSAKYPLQVHNMYRDRLLKKQKTVGEWSSWSSWTPCSRSCGGGVTQQTRHCINRPADPRFVRRQRRRRQANGCVGLYKRIHLCNTQSCPLGTDFRYEQCAAFNSRLFKGKTFYWEPFLQAPDECALNCRAVGMRFYATLNKTVIDGTSCIRPMTSYGRLAPKGTRGVCIDGYCKSVNANGIIGGVDDNQEECAACLKGKCRSINGLYTRPDLPPGYSLVAQVPQGACRVLVQQLKHTRNFLALKNANGTFIINGDWKISNSRVVDGAGTRFTYVKQDGTTYETISSPGPLANPVDIMIVNFQINPGVKYGYSLPIDPNTPIIAPPLIKRPPDPLFPEPRRLESPSNSLNQRDEARPAVHRRTRLRRRFAWKISGVSACSKSCGGGVQATVVSCVREHTQTPAPERRCAHLERPPARPLRCNVGDCPPRWEARWGACSATCGEGVQHLGARCVREGAGGVATAADADCAAPKPPPQARPCARQPCEDASEPPRGAPGAAPWLATEWSHCSEACGTGTQERLVVCLPGDNCTDATRPETSRACSSERQCGGQWFAGPWGPCSDSCSGAAAQRRDVLCVVRVRGTPRVAADATCPAALRPEGRRPCAGRCPPRWFLGEWGACECPGGLQRRRVRCLEAAGAAAACEGEAPQGRRRCACDEGNRPAQDEPVDRSCVDRIRNCYLAVQARLCKYHYYTSHCCVSCKKAQQDLLE